MTLSLVATGYSSLPDFRKVDFLISLKPSP